MLARKMRIAEGTTVVALHAPAGYKRTLGTLPKGVTIKDRLASGNDFVHLFVKNKKELDKEFFKVARSLREGALLWISYPKGSSGIQTDLTRDKGWESLSKVNMRWMSLISFDSQWSAFLMKNIPAPGQSRDSKEYHSNKEQWSDAKTKTVKIPHDLAAAFRKSKKAEQFFHALSFTGRKEYVMWIVSAKREETRAERLKKTVEKLIAGKKLPSEK